ncbi:MAG: hypothetical protein FWD53_01595 [Phycisphaerales bacterium]|nr:hypothetical protein [Phycisphaerales bacterium]
MNRRERLLSTLAGRPVDRPPVSFYELDWYADKPLDQDPFNIHNHPSWRPLLQMIRERVDRIVCGNVKLTTTAPSHAHTETKTHGDKRTFLTTIKAGARILTMRKVLQADIDTYWTIEYLLKDVDDFRAYLDLPLHEPTFQIDASDFLRKEAALGDGGIMLLDTGDPLCAVAPLFSMEDYTVIAFTEPELFRQALDRAAVGICRRLEAITRVLPGQMWRIYGPEYASEPYLPPQLFEQYVVPYVKKMVEIIHATGGFARVHSHGRLKNILHLIAATGCDGIDPIEPPPQGDVSLAYVRERYGPQWVLFGNLEASDIENVSPAEMRSKTETALREGTQREGRGMVLMPSSGPYGRILSERACQNYATILDVVEAFDC